MGTSAIRLYVDDLRKTSILTPDEEYSMALKKEQGDLQARNYLIESNTRLAFKLALRRYRRSEKYSLEEYVEVANLALVESINRYTLNYNNQYVRVTTYATFIINQRLSEFERDNDSILTFSETVYFKWEKITEASCKLLEELRREPSLEEIAKELNVKVELLKEWLKSLKRKRTLSLDHPMKEGNERPLSNFIPDPTSLEDYVEVARVNRFLESGLDKLRNICSNPGLLYKERNDFYVERNLQIFICRYTLNDYRSDPPTLEEVGDSFGMTRERVRQVMIWVWERIKDIFIEEEFILVYTLLNMDINQRGKTATKRKHAKASD